jgi:putative colanic acid biosynthesis glycosyltransferase
MKIALIDVNYNYGSTGKIVASLDIILNNKGYKTEVYFGRKGISNKSNIIKISSNFEIIFHAACTRLTGLTDQFSYFSTQKLIRHLEDFKPDVVHLHDIHGYFLNIYTLVEYLKNKLIPTTWTFHSDYMFTGKCGFSGECDKWKIECNNCPKLQSYPKSFFFDFSRHLFNKKKSIFKDFNLLHLVAPTKWLADRMSQSIIKNKKISVIPNGIDLNNFSIKKNNNFKLNLGIKDKDFVVLSIISSNPLKGSKWIFELAERNIEKSIVFVLLETESKFYKNIKNNKNIIIIPYVSDQKLLSNYYSIADIFLITSQEESFSMPCIESLASGTPVIGFKNGGAEQVVMENYGKFVGYGDLNALHDLLSKIKESHIKLKSKEECAQFAKKNYSDIQMVHSYNSIYYNLLNH